MKAVDGERDDGARSTSGSRAVDRHPRNPRQAFVGLAR